jgi:outer membrane protein assembly factor BamB
MRAVMILFILASAVQASPEIELQIETLYFGSVSEGGSHQRDFIVGNVGDEDLTVDAVDLLEVFDLTSPSLPISIEPGSDIIFSIVFRPAGTQSYDGSIWIYSNDPTNSELELPELAQGIPAFEPGEIIWSYQGIENVESSTAIGDRNSDGFPDVVAESYDAGASGDHLLCISGSGYLTGDLIWSAHPQGGPSNSGGYGDQCLRTIGDLNGNGTEDILLGTAWGCRTVFGIESSTGETIWSYDTYENPPSGWIYSVCPMDDLNDDGIPEALAGAGSDANAGYCLDGATGEALWSMQASDAIYSTVAIGDVDDDQVPDAVFGGGDPSEDRVFCISGASSGNGTQIWTYSTGGSVWSVDAIEDIDGDGYDDVIAGTWYGGDRVLALSGHSSVTPDLIWEASVGYPVMKVVTCSDLNDDGYQDIIVASWASYVLALSGIDGSELWTNQAGDDVWTAYWSYDLTGDGVVDVLAGSFTGSVILTDGVTGETVWERPTNAKIFTVRPIGDVNGDGGPDVIAGQQMLSGVGGMIFLISGGAMAPSCVYATGDCDHNGTPLELGDVVAMIGMYRGTAAPSYTCDCPPHGGDFAPEADPNGNCVALELVDVVTEIAAYRGLGTALGCYDCPGSRR